MDLKQQICYLILALVGIGFRDFWKRVINTMSVFKVQIHLSENLYIPNRMSYVPCWSHIDYQSLTLNLSHSHCTAGEIRRITTLVETIHRRIEYRSRRAWHDYGNCFTMTPTTINTQSIHPTPATLRFYHSTASTSKPIRPHRFVSEACDVRHARLGEARPFA